MFAGQRDDIHVFQPVQLEEQLLTDRRCPLVNRWCAAEDEPAIRQWLTGRAETMRAMWEPFL